MTPTSPMEMAAVLAGLLMMLCGAREIWKERGRPGRLILWGALVDLGAACIGFSLGLSGNAGGLLMLVYHGAARLTAWLALARLVAFANSANSATFASSASSIRQICACSLDEIRNAARQAPLSAIILAFALLCSLGVSPVLTPEGLHLVLHSVATFPSPLAPPLLLLMAGAFTVMLWQSAETILAASFTRPEETEEGAAEGAAEGVAQAPQSSARGQRTLYALCGLLALMGIFRVFFHDLAVRLVGGLPQNIVELEGPWSLPALVLYIGAFLVLCPRLVRPARQGHYALGLSILTFLLVLLSPLPPLAFFFALIITGIGMAVASYSIHYIEDDGRKAWYWFFLLLTFAALLSIVTTSNIGNLSAGWEVMSWASFALIAWERTPKARAAAVKYAVICGGAAYLMIAGLFMLGGQEAAYNDILVGISSRGDAVLRFALVFTLIGFMAKAGLAPLHGWLPDAHPAAPSSVSAPLSGVLTKMGLFGIVLVYYVLAGQADLLGLGRIGGLTVPGLLATLAGLATMAVGEISALRQSDLKRMLAYSTMGQIGEIVTVLGLGTWLSLTGSLAHVLNHAIMKDLLFLCAGALILRAGSRELADLAGLGRRMPWTVGCMSIGIISIMGLPPFNGFVSKYIMIVACMDAGQPLLAVALLAASLVGAIYYMRILRTLLLDPERVWRPQIVDVPLSMRLPLVGLAALCVLFGIAPQSGLSLVTPVVDALGLFTGAAGPVGSRSLPALSVTWPCFVLLPMLGAFLPWWYRENPRTAGWSAVAVLALTTLLVILFGRDLDILSFCFALLVPAIGALNMAYAVGYMEHSHSQWRFYVFFLFMSGGLTGVAASTDLFSFFTFWEIMSSWALYFVIAHEGSREALGEAFKYFLFNVAGAGFLFLGIGIITACTGSSRFDQIGALLAAVPPLPALSGGLGTAAIACLTLGFLMKAAQLSLRIDWQMHPDLAPTPVSGYISSMLLKIAVFGLVKVFLLFGGAHLVSPGIPDLFHQGTIMTITAWIGAFTLLYSAVQAMLQVRLKLVFIWSTVSQIGYMVLGVAVGTSLGMAGGLMHLVNHIFFKDVLFLMAGAVMFRTHFDTIADLGGLGRRMPLTMFCFLVSALTAIGVPPTSGFTSKWIIYQALMQAGQPLLALISLLGSVITLAYLARFLHIVFLGQPSRDLSHVEEAPKVMLVPMLLLVAVGIVTGIFPGLLLAPINAAQVQYGLPPLTVAWSGLATGAGAWNATLATFLMVVAFALVWYGLRRVLATVPMREAPAHACGHDVMRAATRMPPDSVFSALVNICTGGRPQERTCALKGLARSIRAALCPAQTATGPDCESRVKPESHRVLPQSADCNGDSNGDSTGGRSSC